MTLRLLRHGRLIPVPPPEKALRYLASEGARRRARCPDGAAIDRRSPSACGPGSRSWRGGYGADEVMVVTITHDHAARRRSYELVAEAFGLGERAGPQPGPSRSETRPETVPR